MRITLKGKGKELEVRTVLDGVGVSIFGTEAWLYGKNKTILPYLMHYIQGYITKDELSNVLIHHYGLENLHVTSLMGTIDEHEQDWKKWAKNPHLWYAYYHKDIDDQTKEVTIRPAQEDDMPQNYSSDLESEDKFSMYKKMLQESQETNRNLASIQSKLQTWSPR
ncbi:MAG: hypothetical protein V3U54_07610 [Thermodesulfobacteriota bacterium]